jgi:hypothetical protein
MVVLTNDVTLRQACTAPLMAGSPPTIPSSLHGRRLLLWPIPMVSRTTCTWTLSLPGPGVPISEMIETTTAPSHPNLGVVLAFIGNKNSPMRFHTEVYNALYSRSLA